MNQTFMDIFILLNYPENNIIVLTVFLALCLLIIVLRVVVCVGYQTQLTLLQFNAKELAARSDIKDTASGLLNRIVKDYTKAASKGAGHIDVKTLVVMHVRKLHFIGWSFAGIAKFVGGFAWGLPLCGVLLTVVFVDFRYVYAIATVAVFIVMRLLESIFDFRLVQEKLVDELTLYVGNEIGRFFAGDTGTATLQLKNELSVAIAHQSEAISQSVNKMGESLSGVLKLSIQEMSKGIEQTVSRLSDMRTTLQEPVEMWRLSISEAAHAQKQLNETCQSLDKIIAASKRLAENTETSQTSNAAVKQQLQYIEKNQAALEESMARYEASLERITQKMGDGFGGMVEFHVQNTYKALNESLQENIRQIINSNNDMLFKLQGLFERMKEQSQSETQAILRIKDQIDMHFENH